MGETVAYFSNESLCLKLERGPFYPARRPMQHERKNKHVYFVLFIFSYITILLLFLQQFQATNQLLIGNTTNCVPVPNTLLSNSADGVYFAALFSQQGAHGVIAFFVLSLLLKNAFNVSVHGGQ